MANEEEFIIDSQSRERISDKELSRQIERYKTATEEVLKYKEIGALIISNEAIQSLNKYFEETNIHTRDYMKHIITNWEAAGSCIKNLIEIAKKDFKGTNFKWINSIFSKQCMIKKLPCEPTTY